MTKITLRWPACQGQHVYFRFIFIRLLKCESVMGYMSEPSLIILLPALRVIPRPSNMIRKLVFLGI